MRSYDALNLRRLPDDACENEAQLRGDCSAQDAVRADAERHTQDVYGEELGEADS